VLASTLIYGELGTNWSSSIQKRNPLDLKPAQQSKHATHATCTSMDFGFLQHKGKGMLGNKNKISE